MEQPVLQVVPYSVAQPSLVGPRLAPWAESRPQPVASQAGQVALADLVPVAAEADRWADRQVAPRAEALQEVARLVEVPVAGPAPVGALVQLVVSAGQVPAHHQASVNRPTPELADRQHNRPRPQTVARGAVQHKPEVPRVPPSPVRQGLHHVARAWSPVARAWPLAQPATADVRSADRPARSARYLKMPVERSGSR